MADQYGENSGDQEHAEGEAWHDDRPPVDDFADPEQTGEEAVTVSHESEPGMEEAEMMGGRRKSMMLPVVAGLGGLVILGGLVYWQFGRAPQPPMMMPAPPVTASSQNNSPSPMPSVPSTGNDGDINSLYAAPKELAADTAPKTAMIPVPAPTSSATPPQAAPAQPENVPPAPVAAATPALPPPPAAPTTAMVPVPPAPSSAGAPSGSAMPTETQSVTKMSPADEARITALETRLDEMEKSFEQATKQLNQVSNMVAATAPATGVEDRINKIEKEIEHTKPATAPAAAPKPAETVAAAEPAPSLQPPSDFSEPVVEPAPVPAKAKLKGHHVKTKAPISHKKTHSAKAATPVHWVLRAATPEEAWVSEDESSPELRHVGIGDSLPGIGRVQAIRQVGDSWVVEGSSGTVH